MERRIKKGTRSVEAILKDMDAEMNRMKFSLNKYADHLKKQQAAKKSRKKSQKKQGAPSNNSNTIPNLTGAESLMPLVPTQAEAAPAEKEGGQAEEKTDTAAKADQAVPPPSPPPPQSFEV